MPHPASFSVERLLGECEVVRTRKSGPGGQHRNKVETAIVMTHTPTGVRAEAAERRSQAENLAMATFRLRVALAVKVRTDGGLPSAPSALWMSRARGGRISINPEHEDFPALLAEALDMLANQDWQPTAAGELLGVSNSQLVKLLKLEPKALASVNAQRQSTGLHPLQ